MAIDFESALGAVSRSVADGERGGKPVRSVTLARNYVTSVEDLWNAVTNGERLPRWFLPVSGDLALGGRYQFEGNAGGTIDECEPPRRLAVTWEFAGGISWVEVLVEPAGGDEARLTLVHTCPVDDHWEKFGPGAVGVGWDLGLLGLYHHLGPDGDQRFDEESLAATTAGKNFVHGCAEGWGKAAIRGGENPAKAKEAARKTAAFYTGETVAER